MTEPQDDVNPDSPSTIDWRTDIVFEEYWSDVTVNPALDPEQWNAARGGDPQICSQLHVLSALRNAGPAIAAWLSSGSEHPTDAQPLSTNHTSAATHAFIPSLTPGELLEGKLRVLAALGAGGMGEVYAAWHQVLEREVAVKVLPIHQTHDADAVARFRRSATLHAKAGGHPNVVAVMDAGEHEGHMYLVMEYVAGVDLAKLLRTRHPIPWREVSEWMRQAACGLDHAHQHHLVHRDIKPANLIRSADGTIKLLDWGLARGGQTSQGTVDSAATLEFVGMGTADYMSPEQAYDAGNVDARSDLYSLGCTFYDLLAGRAPFAHHKSASAKVIAHSKEAPPPLSALRPDVARPVLALVDELLEKDPRRRPSTAYEVSTRLESILDSATPVRINWSVRRAIAFLTLLVFAAIGYGVWSAFHSSPSAANVDPMQWEHLDLFIQNAGKNTPIKYSLASSENREFIPPFRPLRADDAFRIEGVLANPVPWVVVWIDTAGKFELHLDDGQGTSREVVFPVSPPTDPKAITVNPNDPKGVHLVLLLASTGEMSTAAAGEPIWHELQRLTTQQWAPPPPIASGVWLPRSNGSGATSEWRGAGGSVSMPTQRSYLDMVQSRLPKGIVPIAGIFLQTKH
jgi:serine/threonine protein kinase